MLAIIQKFIKFWKKRTRTTFLIKKYIFFLFEHNYVV